MRRSEGDGHGSDDDRSEAASSDAIDPIDGGLPPAFAELDDLLIPMRSQWQPGAVAWGVVAFYLLLAVEGTSVVRGLQWRLWHRVHLLSYPMWVLASVHVLVAGTDTGRLLSTTTAVVLGVVVTGCAAVALVRALRSAHLRRPGLRPQA